MNIKQRLKDLFLPTMYQASCLANEMYLFRVAAMTMRDFCLRCNDKCVTDERIADAEVIVSLTTYSKRFYDVYLTIESIMQGTMKPNRIILWLAEEMREVVLPIYLKKQVARGLEVRYSKDIRSYKKLIPALRVFPESIIVTIDDDVIYEPDVLEKLVNAYNINPHYIYANRVNRMKLNSDGSVAKYSEWSNTNNVGSSPLNFFTGVGGVLYPPHSLADEVVNEDAFMALAPYGDDIWFYAMALLNGYIVSKVYTHSESGSDFLTNQSVQDISLYHVNTEGENLNDKQIKAVFEKYGINKLLKQ